MTALLAAALLMVGLLPAGSAAAQQGSRRLVITDTDISSAPTIAMTIFGQDGSGAPIDFSTTAINITHDGQPVPAESIEIRPDGASSGAFTMFLLDIPPGVESRIPDIEAAVTQFAAPPYMEDTVDYVAIFQVGATAPTELLAASNFNNSVINAFANPLSVVPGSTALYDSVLLLLNNAAARVPVPGMPTNIVVMSDGTDSVSSAEAVEVQARAAALGIPVHTVWLENPNVSNPESGTEFLEDLADSSGGISIELGDSDGLTNIYTQIDALSRQTLVLYTIPTMTGGAHTAVISLQSDPATSASTTFTIPPAAPTVTLNIPEDSRTLELENLDGPVALSLSTTVSWIDGVDRAISQAQLLVNGVVAQDLDPTTLDRFEVSISNFIFGENRIQVAVIDEAGNRANSAEIVLLISQGTRTVVPDEMQPESESITGRITSGLGSLGSAVYWAIGCVVTIIMVIILFFLITVVLRSPLVRQFGLQRYLYAIPFLRPYLGALTQAERMQGQANRLKRTAGRYTPDVRGSSDRSSGGSGGSGGRPTPYLEVLEAVTRTEKRIDLTEVEYHFGRSPKQAEIVFEDDITVSRIHATLVREGNDYRIFDEQSTSGTFVNEQRVPDYGLQLIDGDEVRLGAVRLRFRQP